MNGKKNLAFVLEASFGYSTQYINFYRFILFFRFLPHDRLESIRTEKLNNCICILAISMSP